MVNINKYIKTLLHSASGHQESREAQQAGNQVGWPAVWFVMPPPLGAGGIMFSGCPSVRPSVRPKPEIPSFDLYIGPLVHPTNRSRFTACPSVRPSVSPSGEVSGHLPENAWREWPEISHADISRPSSELISLWPWSVDLSNFCTILT